MEKKFLTEIEDRNNQIIESGLYTSFDNIIEVMYNISSRDISNQEEELLQLQNEFISITSRFSYIDQMRFLGLEGDEYIRINNYNKKVDIVSKDRLQNKKDRYYFTESYSLNIGEIYISRIDLNIEYDKVEQPQKNMIRFITPLSMKEIKQGFLVINCNIDTLLQQISPKSMSFKTLVESEGVVKNTQKEDKNGITIWRTLNYRAHKWLLTNYISSETLNDKLKAFQPEEYSWIIPSCIIILLLYFMAIFYVTHMRNRRKEIGRELFAAEKRHRIISDMVSEVSFVLSNRWRLLWLSSGAYYLCGYTDSELLSTPSLLKMVYPPDRAKVIHSLKTARITASTPCEHRILTKDGSMRWVATFFRMEIMETGKKQYYIAIQDITEKKKSSGELEAIVIKRTKELQLVTKAVEQSKSSIIIIDNRGIIKYCNPEFYTTSGYEIDEVINRDIYLLEDGHSYNLIRKIIEEGKPWQGELTSINKSGKKIVELVSISPIINHMNIITEYILVKENITKLKKAQKALSLTEKRYSLLFQTMLQGVVYQDSSGAIIEANPAAERILGLTLDQLAGRTSVDPRWRSLRHDGTDFPGEQHPAMLALKSGHDIEDVTMGVYHPGSNTYKWILVNAKPLFRDGEDTPYQVYTTFYDITRRKMMEERLIDARSRAESSAKSKSTFLANMSHEIRTPMNAIIGYIDLVLESKNILKRDKKHLEIARTSAEGLLHIINDVLDLSKLEAGKLVIENRKFNIKDLIKTVSSQLECTIPTDIKFHIQFNNDFDYCVIGDDNRLRQVLINLVGNAVKFTKKGFITVDVKLHDDEYIHFNITDSGIGMTKKQLQNIFDPFNQADNSTARLYGGTGLGTSICKELVTLMGGEISVESKLGIGTHFEFTIPMKLTKCGTRCKRECENYKKLQGVCSMNRDESYRILIVEDIDENAQLLKLRLEQQDHVVLINRNGEEAIKTFEKGSIDLIIMDIQMPVMDGLTATRIIREIEGEREDKTPIIALTASVMPHERDSYLKMGITEVLAKPVDFIDLFHNIDTLLKPLIKEEIYDRLDDISERLMIRLEEDNMLD